MRFIDDRETPTPPSAPASGKKLVTMKMDASLVERIDREAKRHGVSRTAWCCMRLSEALDQLGR